jgi:hypothetical protein
LINTFVDNTRIDEMDLEKQAQGNPASPTIPVDELARHVTHCWQAAKDAKQEITDRLIECRRRVKGEYDPEKLAAIQQFGSVEIYLKHTGLKKRAACAWIKEVIQGEGKDTWTIDPTEIPDIPENIAAAIYQATMREVMGIIQATGQMPTPEDVFFYAGELRDEVEETVKEEAKTRARRMARLIKDQFQEGNHRAAMDEFIDDLCTYPTAFLKGPELVMKEQLEWDQKNFKPIVKRKAVPCDRRVSPFDMFPSPQCKNVNDGYIIERMRMTRHEISMMKGTPGYNDRMIDLALSENQEGTMWDEVDDTTRLTLEGKSGVHEATGTGDDRLIVHQFWGRVSGLKLISWGMHPEFLDKGVTSEYEINALKIGERIIKAVLNPDPMGRRPYYATSYEKNSDSIWGTALAELMAPIQDAMNAIIRAILDNVALAVQPQTVVDLSRIDASQVKHAAKIWPKKVHLIRSSGLPGGQSPVSFEQIRLVVNQLMALLDKLQQFSDDYSGVPAYTYGNENISGAGETASGLNMLLNAASKGIRQIIGNVGRDVVAPRVEYAYVQNMLFHPDPLVKGDCKINARGAMGEIMRQQLKNDRAQFMQLALTSETVLSIIKQEGAAKLLRATTEDLEMPDLVPSEDELLAQSIKEQSLLMQQEMAGQEQEQPPQQ